MKYNLIYADWGKMLCIGKNNRFYDDVANLYERTGIGSVNTQQKGDIEIALFLFVAKDNNGDNVYIVAQDI